MGGSVLQILCFLFIWLVAVTSGAPEILVASCEDELGDSVDGTVWGGHSGTTITVNVSNHSCNGEELLGLSIHTFSSNATDEYPLVVIARQGIKQDVFSWTIPYHTAEHNISFRNLFRTMCPINITSEEILELEIYSTSPAPIHYELSAQLLTDFNLELNNSVQFRVTPTSPKIFYFKFPSLESTAIKIKLDSLLLPYSSSSGCFILSAHKYSCPIQHFSEDVEDVRKSGFFQTVNGTTELEVQKAETSEEIIISIIAVKRTMCSDTANDSMYSNESFHLSIVNAPPLSEFVFVRALPVIVFFAGIVPMVIIFTILHIFTSCDYKLFCILRLRIHKCGEGIRGKTTARRDKEDRRAIVDDDDKDSELQHSSTGETVNRTDENMSSKSSVQFLEREAEIYLEDKRKTFFQIKCGKQICLKHIKYNCNKHCMNESSEDYPARVNRKFMFLWNTLVIGVYYGLPTLQHLYTLLEITKFTGERDRCYFNYKCAHSWGIFTSFSNIWSNIAYLLFGGLFLVIAVVKNVTYCVKRRKPLFDHIGLPEYYGIYYAMGVLAILEGIMSALYHICPTEANFQYDNACMIVFGGLVIVHILYKRHPVDRVNAGLTYVLFSVITFLILVGLIAESLIGEGWRAFLVIVFFLLAINFTFSFYCLHDWKYIGGPVKPNYKDTKKLRGFRTFFSVHGMKKYKWKIIKTLIGTIMNLILALVFSFKTDMAFSTAVLSLFIINDTFFILLYMLAKIYFKEYFSMLSTVTAILTLVFLVLAAYCLRHTEYETKDSPSLSRQKNHDCRFDGFYDFHDMWHFLSSIAMFFCFVHLLTLDDGVSTKKRSKIHAF